MLEPLSLVGLMFSLIRLFEIVLLVVGLVDAARRPAAAFVAAGKQTKKFWLVLLGVLLAVLLLLPGLGGAIGIGGIVATVAGIVYQVDVRPALKAVGPGGGGGTHMGPYGPW